MATRVLATGLAMGESPRWHDGRLWLCDWLAGEVLTVDAGGRTEAEAIAAARRRYPRSSPPKIRRAKDGLFSSGIE